MHWCVHHFNVVDMLRLNHKAWWCVLTESASKENTCTQCPVCSCPDVSHSTDESILMISAHSLETNTILFPFYTLEYTTQPACLFSALIHKPFRRIKDKDDGPTGRRLSALKLNIYMWTANGLMVFLVQAAYKDHRDVSFYSNSVFDVFKG